MKAIEKLITKAISDVNPLHEVKVKIDYGYPVMVTFSWVKSQKLIIDFTDEWMEKEHDADIIFIHANDTIEKVESKINSVITKINQNELLHI